MVWVGLPADRIISNMANFSLSSHQPSVKCGPSSRALLKAHQPIPNHVHRASLEQARGRVECWWTYVAVPEEAECIFTWVTQLRPCGGFNMIAWGMRHAMKAGRPQITRFLTITLNKSRG